MNEQLQTFERQTEWILEQIRILDSTRPPRSRRRAWLRWGKKGSEVQGRLNQLSRDFERCFPQPA